MKWQHGLRAGNRENDIQQTILRIIGDDQVLLDALLLATGLPMPKLSNELMHLELAGLISTKGGRYFKGPGWS